MQEQQKISKTLRRKVTILNIIVPFLGGTAIDLYVPSLPMVANYFHVQNYLVQLSISFYMLGYAVGQIILGVMADCWGRKKILLGSGICFTVISFIAAWSPNIYVLNSCRFLQGLAVAGFVLARVITMDCFSGLDLIKAMTAVSISWALGPIIGPFIGGYLQHYFNWQASFYFFGCYGVLIFLFTLFFIPETNREFLCFNMKNLLQVVVTIVSNKIFLCYSAVLSLTYAALVIFNIVGPFLIQEVLKYSVVEYGHMALLLGLGYFLGNITSRFLVNYFSPLRVAFVGMCLSILTSLVLMGLGLFVNLNLLIVIIPVFLLFFFCGLIFPNIAGMTMNLFNENKGIVSSTMGTLQISGVFLLSSSAVLLKTNSQMPLAVFYVAIMLINLLLFLVAGITRARRVES